MTETTKKDPLLEALQKQAKGIEDQIDILGDDNPKEMERLLNKHINLLKQVEEREAKFAPVPEADTTEQFEDDPQALFDSMEEFLEDNDLYFITSANCYCQYFPDTGKWLNYRRDALLERYPILKDKGMKATFDSLMEKQHRKFEDVTFDFAAVPRHTLNRMKKDHWLTPDLSAGEDGVHWLFDTLMHSLGGAKPENINHLEQVLTYKFLHPEEYKLPALVVYGEGGTGKNLLVDVVWKQIVGHQAVSLSQENVTGNFNGMMIGKTVVFLDEGRSERADMDAFKRLVGNPTIQVNEKYGPQYVAANTALYLLGGNGATGAVKLAGDKSDRRWSVIRNHPGQTLAFWVGTALLKGIVGEAGIKHMEKPEFDGDIDRGGYEYIKEHESVFKDSGEVAKWLGSLVNKWGDLKTYPSALHGEDFKTLIEDQRGVFEECMDRVLRDESFTFITGEMIYRLYKKWTVDENPAARPLGKGNFLRCAKDWVIRHAPKVDWATVKVDRLGIRSTTTGFVLNEMSGDIPDTTPSYAVLLLR